MQHTSRADHKKMPFAGLAERTRSGAIKKQRRLLPREEWFRDGKEVEPKDRKSHRQAAKSIGAMAPSINRWLIPFGSQKYVELGRPGSLVGPECKAPHLIERTIILRVPLSFPIYLSLSRLSPIRLLQFETEYISRSATSTDARQDKWPRDGGYITFQNWPNRRLSGDEKEGPIYRAAGLYTCIDRRGVARRGEARCSAMHCLFRVAATSSLFKDSSSARFPNRRVIFERGFSHS